MTIMIENLGYGGTNGGYLSGSILFSLATKKDDKRYRVMEWSGCRDYINDALIANVNGKHKYDNGKKIEYDIDFEKLRLLIDYGEKNKKNAVFTAKRMINAYEKIAGFKERSIISSVLDAQSPKIEPAACLFTGPVEWLKCSQLVSLITLVTRIFYRISDGLPKDISFENIKEINAFWEGIVTKKRYAGIYDVSYYAKDYKKWGVLMENFAEVFDGLKSADLYPTKLITNWHGFGGIVSLSHTETQIKELDSRLTKLFKRTGCLKN